MTNIGLSADKYEQEIDTEDEEIEEVEESSQEESSEQEEEEEEEEQVEEEYPSDMKIHQPKLTPSKNLVSSLLDS